MIKTARTTVRLITEDDWRQVRRILIDFSRSEYARYDRPSDTDEGVVKARVAKWAAANTSGTEHMFYAVCLDETMIGYCAFNKRDSGYELGYCFDSAYQGRGYAKESISALISHFCQAGIKKYLAGTAINNIPSVSLLNSLGFKLTGTEKVSFYKDADGTDIVFEGGIFELTCEG